MLRVIWPCILLLPAIILNTHAQDSQSSVLDGQIFTAAFDGTEDVGLFPGNGDGGIYTADSLALTKLVRGNHIKEVSIAKGAGRFGDALHFTGRTKQVLLYKGSKNGVHPKDNWSGTVSVWLKLDPDKDLPAGFCDPIQITSKKWNDASFFIDFDKELPRDFRLGVFSDYKFWNPTDTGFEDVPVAKRPMVTVHKPPFASDKWTHVVFTFANINATNGRTSTASLYLNGEPQGSLNQPLKFTWNKTKDRPDGALIMLGINYVGYMDNLSIWNRALGADEVRRFYRWRDTRGLIR
ncbi:MAG TPA: LamG domain-containing protein [Planctomycetes bacterium]|nr:LamG domain-containing protein [Fuerstiella sp.]HIK95479.1 LamG domain-containing protein [Planctomycetota bacterium]